MSAFAYCVETPYASSAIVAFLGSGSGKKIWMSTGLRENRPPETGKPQGGVERTSLIVPLNCFSLYGFGMTARKPNLW
jgi:hypothetical protein